jgi:hypothetical protein
MQTYNLNPVNAHNWLVNGHQATHGPLSEFSDKDDNKDLALSPGNGQHLEYSQKNHSGYACAGPRPVETTDSV